MRTKAGYSNIPIVEFSRRLWKGGRISAKGLLLLPLYYIQLVMAFPFIFLQWLFFARRIKKTIITKDPVFILGHYRSGTTYLHKLMASDKRFGYLTNYDSLLPNANLLLGKSMQRFIQPILNMLKMKNPFFNNSIVRLTEPAEEDDYLMNKASPFSAYWGFVFPKRWHEWLNCSTQFSDEHFYNGWKAAYLQMIKYITYKHKGQQLILKSPPNTERIKVLLELFPDATFIYLYRNPYHLFYSMKNMWRNVILKYYSIQKIPEDQIDEIVFSHFEYITTQYERDKHLIPVGNLIEISYEELKQDAFATMRNVYTTLHLPSFTATAADMLKEVENEKDYKNFLYQYDEETLKKINERWGKYCRKWHYENY